MGVGDAFAAPVTKWHGARKEVFPIFPGKLGNARGDATSDRRIGEQGEPVFRTGSHVMSPTG
ncbi:hypothetical protein U875_15435 [Pandoraea pnomenusa 3kgm]|nr:hypothetical protein U875_15435 [Pandoraea pnomenusa 3kgm]AHB78669.1 hypothetical protein X636_19360 [Pandoraea pnomenusa]